MSTFVSVNTSAARVQDLSLNPQKLTGLCGKLKCCMNYEVQAYTEAQRSLPSREIVLETKRASYHYFKTDSFQRQITYSTVANHPVGLVTISAQRAFEVISMNKQGERPDTLEFNNEREKPQSKPLDILSDNSLTRFDKKGNSNGHKNGSRRLKNRESVYTGRRREGGSREHTSARPNAEQRLGERVRPQGERRRGQSGRQSSHGRPSSGLMGASQEE